MNAPSEMTRCGADVCTKNGVVTLFEKALCLEHFFQGCYGRLELLDPMVRGKSRECAANERVPNVLEELVKQVLIVCLQQEKLTNLDRSRLLDILLWAGELQFVLRVPRRVSQDGIAYGVGRSLMAGARSLSGS